MKMKWYFGALIIVFTLLGVYQNRISVPNQEIVLNFTDVNITTDEADNTIEIVKEQLEAIGINILRVNALKDRQIKIAYYSTSDVASIKEILSYEKNLKIGITSQNKADNSSEFPSDKKSKKYKLDIYEIHKSTDSESGLDGKFVLTIKQDFDRFYNPIVIIFNNAIDANDETKIAKVSYKIYYSIAIAIDSSSGNIPNVRAGPSTNVII